MEQQELWYVNQGDRVEGNESYVVVVVCDCQRMDWIREWDEDARGLKWYWYCHVHSFQAQAEPGAVG